MRRALPLVLLTLFACDRPDSKADGGKKDDPAADSNADAADKSDGDQADGAGDSAESDGAPVQHARDHAPKPKADEAKKMRRKLLGLLNEGRALTKKGSYDEAMAKYREALEIDASDVSVLAELGWAAYKSGDLDLAHRSTLNALKFCRSDKQRGMLLYNLGRVEEDRGQIDLAIDSYTGSLDARPGNATVQGRLDALLAAKSAGDAPDHSVYSPLPVLADGLVGLDAVCGKVIQERCEDYAWEEGEPCTCDDALVGTPSADATWGLLAFGNAGFPSQRAWFPVVKTSDGWTVFTEVLYEYNPGAFGIHEEVAVGEGALEGLVAGRQQLVIRAVKGRVDSDMGLNEVEVEDLGFVLICDRDGAKATCTRPLYEAFGYSRDILFEDEEGEFADIDHEGLPIDVGFDATISFVDGHAEVARTSTRGGYDTVGAEGVGWVLAPGRHPLRELLGVGG